MSISGSMSNNGLATLLELVKNNGNYYKLSFFQAGVSQGWQLVNKISKSVFFLLAATVHFHTNGTACIKRLCSKMAVLNCNRCLIELAIEQERFGKNDRISEYLIIISKNCISCQKG
jgi:hypothetical protein